MKKLVSMILSASLLMGTVAFADAPVIPQGTLNAQVVEFEKDDLFPVFSAPDSHSLRGANGRAAVSTNDWIQVFGRDGKWLLVQYDITDDHYRIGYITKKALPEGTTASELIFTDTTGTLNKDTVVTDDPLMSQSELVKLHANAEVKCLGTMGSWTYVEAEQDGKKLRGFVPTENLGTSQIVTDMQEARAAILGSWALYAGNSINADRITFNPDTTVEAYDSYGGMLWRGTWELNPYDVSTERYWNQPEFDLIIRQNGGEDHYGLRVCWQTTSEGSGYALIFSGYMDNSGIMLIDDTVFMEE